MRRRAQIRGIDFTIALIIYVLVMSQIIVLTTNLLQTTQQVQINESQGTYATVLADRMITLPGNPSNWETLPSATLTNWNLGLKGSTDQISPYKLGRLADNNLATYQLNYSQLQTGLNTSGNPFKLEILYTISNNITAFALADPVLTVTGKVQQELQPLAGAEVIVFGIADTGDFVSAQTTSADQGRYTVDLNFPSGLPQYGVIISVVSYGSINQAVDIEPFKNGGIRNKINLSVFEDATSTGSTLNVTLETSRTLDIYALYMPVGINHASNSTVLNSNSAVLSIPQSGVVAIVAFDNIEVGYTAFPVALNNDIAQAYEPTNPAGDSVVISRTFAVRGIVMRALLTIWEV